MRPPTYHPFINQSSVFILASDRDDVSILDLIDRLVSLSQTRAAPQRACPARPRAAAPFFGHRTDIDQFKGFTEGLVESAKPANTGYCVGARIIGTDTGSFSPPEQAMPMFWAWLPSAGGPLRLVASQKLWAFPSTVKLQPGRASEGIPGNADFGPDRVRGGKLKGKRFGRRRGISWASLEVIKIKWASGVTKMKKWSGGWLVAFGALVLVACSGENSTQPRMGPAVNLDRRDQPARPGPRVQWERAATD